MRWLCVWVTLLALALTGCSGGSSGATSGGPPAPAQNSLGLTNVDIDDSRSSRATVGTAGGTLTTAAADGTTYTLTIPANVLLEDTEIGMYPIVGLDEVGGSSYLVGVHLTPEGLSFDTPAALTIRLRGGRQAVLLAGISYAGDGAGLHRYPVTAGDGTLIFHIPHFSGFAGAQILPETIGSQTSAEGSALDTIAGALFELALLTAPSADVLEVTAQEVAEAIRTWYTGSVRPRLASIPLLADPLDAQAALNEYSTWRLYASGYVLSASIAPRVAELLQAEAQEASGLAAAGLRAQFDLSNQEALQSGQLSSAEQALGWYGRARSLGLDTQANRLDEETILADLVVDVVFEEIEFPDPIGALESGTLRVQVGYRIGTGMTRFDQPMDVFVGVQNGQVTGPPVGVTDSQGVFTTTVQRQSDSDLTIQITAAFGSPPLDLLSGEAAVVRGSPEPSTVLGTYSGQHDGILNTRVNGAVRTDPGPVLVAIQPDSVQADLFVTNQGVDFRLAVFFQPEGGGWTLNGSTVTAQGIVGITSIPGATFTATVTGNQISGEINDDQGGLVARFTAQRQAGSGGRVASDDW